MNLPALRRLVQYVLAGGIHGLFVAGSQGEFYALGDDERVQLAEVVVEEVSGRVPICVGTGAVTTCETIRCTQKVARVGVDAVSVITPYYVRPSGPELLAHFRAVAASTELPILLYNNPARTGVVIQPEVAAQLADQENIVGIKDSSGDLTLLAEYVVTGKPTWNVLVGRDSLIHPAIVVGAKGAVASTANVAPRLVAEIYDAAVAGNHDMAQAAQRRLNPLRKAFDLGTFPSVIKEALNLIGMDVGQTRSPVGSLDPGARAELARILAGLGLDVVSPHPVVTMVDHAGGGGRQ